jgi:hypothetical protein
MALEYDDDGFQVNQPVETATNEPLVSGQTQASAPSKRETYPGKEPTKFEQFGKDSGKYDIKNYQYPYDLTTDLRYGGNYVIFYINVAEDSKLISKYKAETVADYPARDVGDNRSMNWNQKSLIGANAGVNTITGIAGGTIGFGPASSTGGAVANAAKGAAVANIGTVGVGVATTMTTETLRSQKRLKTAIALHTPNKLGIKYGVTYDTADTAALGMVKALGGETADAILNALGKQSKDTNVTGVAQAVITNLALSKGPNAEANSQILGMAANPKKEQVFKGVEFRSFSFEYQFFPRDIDEADNVLRIIEEFKFHMHPEFKDDNNFVYLYPSEFDIFYYQGGEENLNLHRHTSCVLTDLDIDYTPNGQFNTFANGMPTQINVTLAFRELGLLTKDKIKAGL